MQAGLWNVVSVPDGASGSTRPVQDFMKASHSKEFNYLYNCRNMLQDPRYCAEVSYSFPYLPTTLIASLSIVCAGFGRFFMHVRQELNNLYFEV